MSRVSQLAQRLLSADELALVMHLDELVHKENERKAWALLEDILPKYWDERNGVPYTYYPEDVYRTLYYLDYPKLYVEYPRYSIELMSNHLEGLLQLLRGRRTRETLGNLVVRLKGRIIPVDMAKDLLEFNEVAVVRAKHMKSDDELPSRLDVRTFDTLDALACLVMVRSLSMRLFQLLKETGVVMPQSWKDFKEEWLSWTRDEPFTWRAIAARQNRRGIASDDLASA